MTTQRNNNSISYRPLTTLHLKITERCVCRFCWCRTAINEPDHPHNTHDLIWTEATHIALTRLQRRLGFDQVSLTGGDPTAHPDVVTLVAQLTTMGLTVRTATSGCSAELLQQLWMAGLRTLHVHLPCTPYRTLIEMLNQPKLAFSSGPLEQALVTVCRAQELGFETSINHFLLEDSDLAAAPALISWASQRALPMALWTAPHVSPALLARTHQLLMSLGAVESQQFREPRYMVHHYRLSGGDSLIFKQHRPLALESKAIDTSALSVEQGSRFHALQLEAHHLSGHSPTLLVRLFYPDNTPDTLMPLDTFLDS